MLKINNNLFQHYNGSISNIYLNFTPQLLKEISEYSQKTNIMSGTFNKFLNFKYKDKYKKYFLILRMMRFMNFN